MGLVDRALGRKTESAEPVAPTRLELMLEAFERRDGRVALLRAYARQIPRESQDALVTWLADLFSAVRDAESIDAARAWLDERLP